MSNLKLGVEVVGAHNLTPKDKLGLSNSFVELEFDGQKFRTAIKEKDLNPVWNESFYFAISDPANLINLTLDASIYHSINKSQSKSFLGKVCLAGTSFVGHSDAVVLHYPLEKRGIFSRVKGELGLKVFLTDDPSIKCSSPLQASNSVQQQVPKSVQIPSPNDKSKSKRHTFRHLPKQLIQSSVEALSSKPAEAVSYGVKVNEMKSLQQDPRFVHKYTGSASQPFEYALKETSPYLGGGQIIGGRVVRGHKHFGTYDLVEQMQYLFVRVVKAHDLPSKDVTGSLNPFVEVRLGNYRGITSHFEKSQNPEWNEVFAFPKETMQSSVLEVVVKDKDVVKDDYVGFVRFDLNEVPTRVPPDSALAPEWYRLERKNGEKKKGELMLAVWIGTQADEAFPDAWHSDAVSPTDGAMASRAHLRSKVYHSPRLWYLRVNVIEAQDLVIEKKGRLPDVYVKVQLGGQILKTRPVQTQTPNALWNEEDLMFVAAEPFEEPLVLSIEDRVGPTKEETVGRIVIPLTHVQKRADDRHVISQWFNMDNPNYAAETDEQGKKERSRFATRLHLRVSLDGGYHVLDESTQYSSDLRPTIKQLWKPSIGVLELGILNAHGLHPMKARDGKGTSDTYCVAKYGHKWIRTRTIINSLSPKYNEQYTWEVYDPATVISVGVFDNSQINEKGSSSDGIRDVKIGKVRIRISTLETGRVYTHSYPLLVLHPSGVKKMGELHLAIRFSSTSTSDMMLAYSRPLLPKMHYMRPLTVMQLDMLRHAAANIVAGRLGRAEPPVRKEVVEYMSDADSHLWSMRRSKANLFRIMSVFSGLLSLGRWFGDVCAWRNPVTTALVHVLFVLLVCFPELILPTVFLYMFLVGAWNFRYRPRYPPHMNTLISCADRVSPEELDEEFDPFPTRRDPDVVRMRYDRLRSVAGRVQTVVGDVATQGERVQALLSWRDPRATFIFMVFCLAAAALLYVAPPQVMALLGGLYVMRHPRFRHRMPPVPVSFFRRLPARTDIML